MAKNSNKMDTDIMLLPSGIKKAAVIRKKSWAQTHVNFLAASVATTGVIMVGLSMVGTCWILLSPAEREPTPTLPMALSSAVGHVTSDDGRFAENIKSHATSILAQTDSTIMQRVIYTSNHRTLDYIVEKAFDKTSWQSCVKLTLRLRPTNPNGEPSIYKDMPRETNDATDPSFVFCRYNDMDYRLVEKKIPAAIL